jgi:hypothetical protein
MNSLIETMYSINLKGTSYEVKNNKLYWLSSLAHC